MNETKKFLDQQGVEYLWSKISMEDYPNNETLINVINAIDETKADKSELNSFVSVEPQELTDEQKLQAQNNISFIKWYRFVHPYTKQIRQFSYDDSFDMDIANSILNVTGYGDNCSAAEDMVDYVISIMFMNATTDKDFQDLWLRAIKVYLKPNFDALQEIGCFKGSTFGTCLNDANTKFYFSKENAIYELTIASRLRGCAQGYARYDSSTDTLTHFTISNLEWNDTTLTLSNYHANAKAVGDALALKADVNKVVSVEPQELTDEQKAQVRANISAINTDYLCYQQPPIYRVDTSNEMIYKMYINLRDLEHGGYYYFNTATQVPENTAVAWMLYYVVVCDDGTEFLVESTSGSNGFKLGAPFFITNFTNSKGITIGYQKYDRMGSHITTKGTPDTASNLSAAVTYNYLSTYSNYEYTPTSDYNPATKKYVDDSVASIPQQIQADWSQIDETAKDFIKNKPEIATDEEIIEMLMAEDMFPVVTDTDGSLLADENGNILLW